MSLMLSKTPVRVARLKTKEKETSNDQAAKLLGYVLRLLVYKGEELDGQVRESAD